MNQFVWKSKFETGIGRIDHQHASMLKYLNQCIADVSNIEDIFYDLKKYAKIHFSEEENLMRKIKYPQLEGHTKEHQFFEERVTLLEQAILNKETKSIDKLVAFLRDWFLEHIMLQDMDSAKYMRSNLSEEQISEMIAYGYD
jgi:hemerythrin